MANGSDEGGGAPATGAQVKVESASVGEEGSHEGGAAGEAAATEKEERRQELQREIAAWVQDGLGDVDGAEAFTSTILTMS